MPTVSVITPVLNAESTIEQTIRSVILQDCDHEHIIVDGGSTDDTIRTIEAHKDDATKVVVYKDSSVYEAINKGITIAGGEYILVLNADDSYFPGAIEKHVIALEATKCDFTYGNAVLRTAKESFQIRPLDEEIIYSTIFQEMPFPHVTCLVRKQVYDVYGLYSTDYKIASDHDFFLRIVRNGSRGIYVDLPTAELIGGGISDSTLAMKESKQIAINFGKSRLKANWDYVIWWAKFHANKQLPQPLIRSIKKLKGSRFGGLS